MLKAGVAAAWADSAGRSDLTGAGSSEVGGGSSLAGTAAGVGDRPPRWCGRGAPLPAQRRNEAERRLPRDRTVLLVCRSGRRSTRAMNMLEDVGLTNVYALGGGILAWRAGQFNFLNWVLLEVGLILAHATNNLLNDYTDFIKGVEKICKDRDLLLIFDEVQV